MFTKNLLFPIALLALLFFVPVSLAQGPRPTPTSAPFQETPRPTDTPAPTETATPTPTAVPIITPTPTPTAEAQQGVGSGQPRGSIRGAVYEDVNGDGKCVNTGVAGEQPVAGVTVEFVSSDQKTIINLTSGPDGGFGLFEAGYSYWAVTAKPAPEWVVTSAKTLYAPVYENSLSVTGVNFCVQKASTARVLLPASGAPFPYTWLSLVGMFGVLLILAGLALNLRLWRRS